MCNMLHSLLNHHQQQFQRGNIIILQAFSSTQIARYRYWKNAMMVVVLCVPAKAIGLHCGWREMCK